jgi:hypothetical protein
MKVNLQPVDFEVQRRKKEQSCNMLSWNWCPTLLKLTYCIMKTCTNNTQKKQIYNTLTSKLGGKMESGLPMCQQWSFNKTKK